MAEDFLLELGAEEIPASFIAPALKDLERILVDAAAAARLKHGEVKAYGTPRRLAVLVKDVAVAGQDITKEVLGPSIKAAFDKDGKPTTAAEKFAASLKLPVGRLGRTTTPKGEYLSATVEEKGRPAGEVLGAGPGSRPGATTPVAGCTDSLEAGSPTMWSLPVCGSFASGSLKYRSVFLWPAILARSDAML